MISMIINDNQLLKTVAATPFVSPGEISVSLSPLSRLVAAEGATTRKWRRKALKSLETDSETAIRVTAAAVPTRGR
jgi:hypothetical protein